MLVKTFIRSTKTNVSSTAWNQDKNKAKDFAVSNRRGGVYPLARVWRWKVTSFEVNVRSFKLLTAYHTQIPEFKAVVAEDLGSDNRLFCQLEFHQTHPGWHIHSICDVIDLVTVGVCRPTEVIRLPSAQKPHRHRRLTSGSTQMNDDLADVIVADFFNIQLQTSILGSIGIPW